MNIKKLRTSITWKLFGITALVFIIFITSTLIFQSLFFSEFYISKKKNDIQSGIEKFRTGYNKTDNVERITELILDFEEKHNAKIVVLDNKGNLKFITRQSNGRTDSLRIKLLNEIIKEWTVDTDILLRMKNSNKPITIITERKINETRNIVSAIPNNERKEIIFAVSSLQPVNEASFVIKEFYFYFYIAAVVFILVLSLIYSNMISKPLLQLNAAASKIADLDFSSKCNIEREDEIGNLAHTLDFLSDNLNTALTSLKEANNKLEEDIQKERRIEKMRKEFVAAVSHELKTPISLIGGYAEGLKDGVFQEDKDYYIDVIIDESKKMADLVSDMLDLSQIESGNFKLIKEEFFVEELIKATLRKFTTLIKEKNLKVSLKVSGNTSIYADWSRMEQVIKNLITNAIRHTEISGNIIVAVENTKDTGIYIYVENTGSHIPEDEKDKIWDYFYKVDKSRNRKLGGTGIGLAIVKKILDLHGYSYAVENTEIGVKFYIRITKPLTD